MTFQRKNLGVSTRLWSLAPTIIAALIAAPLLTAIGTGVALWAGSIIVEMYNLGSTEDYWDDVADATWAPEHSVWQTYPPFVLAYRSVGAPRGPLHGVVPRGPLHGGRSTGGGVADIFLY